MDPASYDAWYATARGRWIGMAEFRLLSKLLQARRGDTLLDVGCGTGWFTRRFAEKGLLATGLDPNPDWLAFAQVKGPPAIRWIVGDARACLFPIAVSTGWSRSRPCASWMMSGRPWPRSCG